MSHFSSSKDWKKRGYRKPGQKPEYAAQVIANRFGLPLRKVTRFGAGQLVRCADNAAIRLLLGCSR
jgi:hypothetical protein